MVRLVLVLTVMENDGSEADDDKIVGIAGDDENYDDDNDNRVGDGDARAIAAARAGAAVSGV